MKDIIINSKLWSYGKENDVLFDGEKYCLLGFFLKDCGISDADMLNLHDITTHIRNQLHGTSGLYQLLVDPCMNHRIYGINDDYRSSLDVIKLKLRNLCHKYNINLIFSEDV